MMQAVVVVVLPVTAAARIDINRYYDHGRNQSNLLLRSEHYRHPVLRLLQLDN
jgi:hypothetical protein